MKWNQLKGAKEYTIYIFNKNNKDLKYIENICCLDYIKNKKIEIGNETDPTYIGIYTTQSNSYNIKEEGVYNVTVVANLEGNIPLKYIFKEFVYDSSLPPSDETNDDGGDNTLLIVLVTVIPITLIIIGVVVYILWKKREKNIEKLLPDENEVNQGLVRESVVPNQEQE